MPHTPEIPDEHDLPHCLIGWDTPAPAPGKKNRLICPSMNAPYPTATELAQEEDPRRPLRLWRNAAQRHYAEESSTVQTFAGVGFGFFVATVAGAALSFTRWESLFLIGLAIGVLVIVGVVALKPRSRTRNILGQQIDAYTWALESPDPISTTPTNDDDDNDNT